MGGNSRSCPFTCFVFLLMILPSSMSLAEKAQNTGFNMFRKKAKEKGLMYSGTDSEYRLNECILEKV